MKQPIPLPCEDRDGKTIPEEQPGQEWVAVRDSLARIVAAAAHELIGPFNQVSSLLALFAKRHGGEAGEEAEVLLALVESAAVRMQATVSGLRTWFDVAGANLLRIPVDMERTLGVAMYLLEAEIKRTGAAISSDGLPAVCGDPDRLTELFTILIGNSLKFQRPGVAPQIRVAARTSGTTEVFSVSDNGTGFDPACRNQLFLPFKKLNGHKMPGAGLGLAVARMIVDLHHGSIWIESQPGEGATVSFALSAAP